MPTKFTDTEFADIIYIFPSKFKLAIVHPLYKKGDPNDYNNYRAISLVCSFSKLLELHLKDRLSNFIQKNKFSLATRFHRKQKY